MTSASEIKQRREFGFIVGGVFLLIGCWPMLFNNAHPRWWSLMFGAILVLGALLVPTALGPMYRAWMFLGHVLGWINTRLLLGIIFYGLVTPMGLIMRLMSKDPMRRRLDPTAQTYRIMRHPRPGSHMHHQF